LKKKIKCVKIAKNSNIQESILYYSSINVGKSICVCPFTCDEKPNYKVKVRAWKFRVSKRDTMKGLGILKNREIISTKQKLSINNKNKKNCNSRKKV
jgi:hypothetical protein